MVDQALNRTEMNVEMFIYILLTLEALIIENPKVVKLHLRPGKTLHQNAANIVVSITIYNCNVYIDAPYVALIHCSSKSYSRDAGSQTNEHY